ncbi:MAG: Gx transporter family protein [Muribaculum sp.]|nr:Gx transporter family protein [Muribaculum sp.]
MSLLASAALALYIIELRLPGPIPIPGMKLGLANIITVVSAYRLKPSETVLVVAVRVLLGALFVGSVSALLFSVCGAAACLCGMLALVRIGRHVPIPVCSVLGAMLHNVGQIAAALWLSGNAGVLAYLPILTVTGGIAGVFTGLCAEAVMRRLPRQER